LTVLHCQKVTRSSQLLLGWPQHTSTMDLRRKLKMTLGSSRISRTAIHDLSDEIDKKFDNYTFHLFILSAKVMMVVQPGERNAFDQRWIEYNLLKQ
jgi:glutathione synthase